MTRNDREVPFGNGEEMGLLKKVHEAVVGFLTPRFFGRTIAEIREENVRLRREVEQYERAAAEAYRDGKEAVLRADGELRLQRKICDSLGGAAKRLEAEVGRLQNLAHHDPLTGLLNRRGATDHLAGIASALWHAANHDGQPMHEKSLACSIVYIDLDNFKPINDIFGHDSGDAILRGVADLLHKTFSRKADLVARIGGDEFVVIMTHADMEGAAKQAEHLLAGLEHDPQFLIDDDFCVGASIGVASMTLRPEVGGLSPDMVTATLDATIKRADQAMYASKRSGKGCISVHRC